MDASLRKRDFLIIISIILIIININLYRTEQEKNIVTTRNENTLFIQTKHTNTHTKEVFHKKKIQNKKERMTNCLVETNKIIRNNNKTKRVFFQFKKKSSLYFTLY